MKPLLPRVGLSWAANLILVVTLLPSSQLGSSSFAFRSARCDELGDDLAELGAEVFL
jgi:hypothetical protein